MNLIPVLLRVSWTNLKRDRVAQALVFLLPILFFSIFATVFGNQGRSNSTPVIRVAVADLDGSELSRRIVEALRQEKSLRVRATVDPEGHGAALDADSAKTLVRGGDVPVAIVLPRGLAASASAFGSSTQAVRVTLLADVSDPIAPQMVSGLLQKVAFTAAPDLMMQGGMRQFEKYAGALTPQQRDAVNAWLPRLKADGAGGGAGAAAGALGIGVDTVDVMREGKSESLISFYAAGIGVMFLLFSVSGASGSLLDEMDTGTLDRVISTRVGMTGLLAAKWIFIAFLGVLQLTVMFLWGRVAFGVDLFHHLPGFAVMTVFTAAAASAFGLMLATLSRTRAQLSGMGTIIILTMSSLGGSMFPRFLMSDTMQKLGLLTFNAWALDGYLKVFWRDAAVWQLWPQVLVLAGITAVLLTLARLFARRWETA
jgi:ABC-2 type transport system permease protein